MKNWCKSLGLVKLLASSFTLRFCLCILFAPVSLDRRRERCRVVISVGGGQGVWYVHLNMLFGARIKIFLNCTWVKA
jgi:hypothetical protein